MAEEAPGYSGHRLLSWHQANQTRASAQRVAALQPAATRDLQIRMQRPQLQSFHIAECVLPNPPSSSYFSSGTACASRTRPAKAGPCKTARRVAVCSLVKEQRITASQRAGCDASRNHAA